MDLRELSCKPGESSDEADARFARGKNVKPPHEARPKRKKYGGRKKGSINKKKLGQLYAAERELSGARIGRKLAIDHMDEMIEFLQGLVTKLVPFNTDGSKREGYDQRLWFRTLDAFQGFLAMRAPYQTARLSAVAIMPQQTHAQRTTVNVTILNERGEKVYSDVADDNKTIEHLALIDQSAAAAPVAEPEPAEPLLEDEPEPDPKLTDLNSFRRRRDEPSGVA